MSGLDLLEMRWADVLFAHWAVDPDVVGRQLPAGLSVDTHEGQAYLGIVGFRMENIRPRGSPIGLTFPELNLRTYVTGEDGPGIYFFNLDAEDRVGVTVARRLFRLPYYTADMRVERSGDTVEYRSHRVDDRAPSADFDATCELMGEPTTEKSDLERFLTERYRFYADLGRGDHLFAGEVDHPPWELQEGTVEFRENDLFVANGFGNPAGEPLVHYSPGVDVTAERIRPVGGSIGFPF